ncbi:MAG: RNA polymerase sigma factor [Rubripirellula sp.]
MFSNRRRLARFRSAWNPDSLIDPATLSEIWDANADRLLLIARSMGGPAEDAVQEAFVALAAQPQLPTDPMSWLVRVMRNRLLQWHRGRRRREAREFDRQSIQWLECDILSVDRRLDADEVSRALQDLDSPDREIIVMHLWGEMTFEAIAEVLGSSKASTHRSFQRGLEQLKKQFAASSEVGHLRYSHEQR